MKQYILVDNKIKKLRDFLFFKFYTIVKEFPTIDDAKNEFKILEIIDHNNNIHNNISKKTIENLLKYYGFCESSYNNVWILEDEKEYILVNITLRLCSHDLTGEDFYEIYYRSYYVDEYLNSCSKIRIYKQLHDKDMMKLNNSLYEIATIDNIRKIIEKYKEAKEHEENTSKIIE